MAKSGLDKIATLAAQLAEKPWAAAAAEEAYPTEYAQVVALAAAPFFRWQPFGLLHGTRYGAYTGKLPCQAGLLESRHQNKWGIAGNRAGKTVCGLMEDTGDALGLSVLTKMSSAWGRGRRPGLIPPTHTWVVTDTEETAINIVEWTLVEQVLGEDQNGFLWNYVADTSKWTRESGFAKHLIQFTNKSTITFKFSTQKRKTFQGARLHKVHFDEVQPQDIYSECLARLADLDGYFLGTMTPIYDDTAGRGIPWIYEELYLQRESKNVQFHQWSLLDNPHIPDAAKERLQAHWNADEIEARVHGAFTPIGVKLAFPNSLIRDCREQCFSPHLGQLAFDEDGRVQFITEDDFEQVLASKWRSPAGTAPEAAGEGSGGDAPQAEQVPIPAGVGRRVRQLRQPERVRAVEPAPAP
jgi:phage terminase large subunit-like protein